MKHLRAFNETATDNPVKDFFHDKIDWKFIRAVEDAFTQFEDDGLELRYDISAGHIICTQTGYKFLHYIGDCIKDYNDRGLLYVFSLYKDDTTLDHIDKILPVFEKLSKLYKFNIIRTGFQNAWIEVRFT